MSYDLLIDLGTGSTRVALTDTHGKILAIRSFFNHYYRDEDYPDAQYFLPEEWETELMRCCDCVDGHVAYLDRLPCIQADRIAVRYLVVGD